VACDFAIKRSFYHSENTSFRNNRLVGQKTAKPLHFRSSICHHGDRGVGSVRTRADANRKLSYGKK